MTVANGAAFSTAGTSRAVAARAESLLLLIVRSARSVLSPTGIYLIYKEQTSTFGSVHAITGLNALHRHRGRKARRALNK
jgi:hypothetical protein